jgi:hypothetical protein
VHRVTVRIHRKVDSETLYLPEIRPFIGKSVEIIVREDPWAATTATTSDWDTALRAAEGLENYDFGSVDRQRAYDLRHAKDHLP